MADNCCGFRRGEWYLYSLYIKTAMFRNGHEFALHCDGLGGVTGPLQRCNFFRYRVIEGVITLAAQQQTNIT
jgi:hypothetical protein